MAKKNKRRRHRERKRRRRNLIRLFRERYPNAPADMGETIVDYSMTHNIFTGQDFPSNTAAVDQATITYVREQYTDYDQTLDGFIENVLQGIEAGQPYLGQSPQSLAQDVDAQVQSILADWRVDREVG